MGRQPSTPTRQREIPLNKLARQPSRASDASATSDRRSSTPRLLRSLSSPSDLLKKMSPSKEKLSPALRKALSLLQLRDLDALEIYFLKTDAFLRPWADFRDGFLLLQQSGVPVSSEPGQITGKDILFYYTMFDEGEKRYDHNPAKKPAPIDAPDWSRQKGFADKSKWGIMEYEKHLFAWLLQSFKVGKTKNPYGFEYFQCRSVCAAWTQVFIPIVEAVRKDYNSKGRYHYGRLAKFIEEVSPSPLAFPESNIRSGQYMTRAATPSNIESPQKFFGDPHPVTGCLIPQTQVFGEEEKELRHVYPQYGQVVERPKFRKSLKEWIQEQKAERDHKRALKLLEGGRVSSPPSPRTQAVAERFSKRLDEARESERKKRQSPSSYNYKPQQQDRSTYLNLSESTTLASLNRVDPDVPRSTNSISSRRGDNHVFDGPDAGDTSAERKHKGYNSVSTSRSTRIPVEAKPSPLEQFGEHHRVASYESNASATTAASRHRPSYEGTAYGSPSLPTLTEGKSFEKPKSTRIPSPIEIPTNETTRKYYPVVDKITVRAEAIPFPAEPPPAIPSKNPKRYNSGQGHVQASHSAQLAAERVAGLGPRIISKENIRAALELSSESSQESLTEGQASAVISPATRTGFAGIGGRGLNTGESPKVPTFNTHMFPRKPVGKEKNAAGGSGSYELKARGRDDEFDRQGRYDF